MSTLPLWLRLVPDRWRDKLADRTSLLAVIHNTGWLFADKALRMLVGVFVGAWLARYLGPSQYGEIAYVLSFVAFFSALAQLGLDSVAVRDMARDPESSASILGTVVRLRVLAGVASWAAAVGAITLLRPGDSETLLLTAIWGGSVVLQAADTVDLWFQSQTQSRRTVAAKAVSYVVASAIKVALIVSQASLVAFVLVGIAELAITAIVLAWSYRRFPAKQRWRWDSTRAPALIKESMPYLMAALAVLIYMRIDQLMLRSLVGEHELGLYSATLPISTALHFVPMAVCMSMAPLIARLRQSDPARYSRAIEQLFSLMWWTMIPLAALTAAAAGPIVSLLYGEKYRAASSMLAIHALSSIPVALGVAQSLWIVNERRNMISFYRTALGALCNVALNYALIPTHGGNGAAIAAVGSQLAAAIGSNLVLAPDMLKAQFRALFKPDLRLHHS